MKEFVEEYGSIIVACFLGLILLRFLSDLLGTSGDITYLVKSFFEGIGSIIPER
ncbi:MAG: hypothetical protein QM793_15145 [Muricomes sp.]